ncbi:hypothetical protein SCA6_018518 [Theobroma cacao]
MDMICLPFVELFILTNLEKKLQIHIYFISNLSANIVQKRQSWEKKRVAIIVGSVIIGMGMLMLPVLCIRWRKRNKKGLTRKNHSMDCDERENEELELPLFNFGTIANATNNFSIENLLGRGGFGSVYKGTLAEGQHIAVKRLSKNSGQGLKEFKNEVILIAKLQHRNLVKLLGCCIQGDEKFGYMSPEYAIDGVFSMKSDVFGIGVLVLEIVSGKKNRGFSHPDHDHNLLGHAWKL